MRQFTFSTVSLRLLASVPSNRAAFVFVVIYFCVCLFFLFLLLTCRVLFVFPFVPRQNRPTSRFSRFYARAESTRLTRRRSEQQQKGRLGSDIWRGVCRCLASRSCVVGLLLLVESVSGRWNLLNDPIDQMRNSENRNHHRRHESTQQIGQHRCAGMRHTRKTCSSCRVTTDVVCPRVPRPNSQQSHTLSHLITLSLFNLSQSPGTVIIMRSSRLASTVSLRLSGRRFYSLYPSPTVSRAFPQPDLLPRLRNFDSFTSTVGNTSLIRLRGPSEATGCEILAKCEWENPVSTTLATQQWREPPTRHVVKTQSHRLLLLSLSSSCC